MHPDDDSNPCMVPLSEFWKKYYLCRESLICRLCGDTGWIDTRSSAIASFPATEGTTVRIGEVGGQFPCLCPCGQMVIEECERRCLSIAAKPNPCPVLCPYCAPWQGYHG